MGRATNCTPSARRHEERLRSSNQLDAEVQQAVCDAHFMIEEDGKLTEKIGGWTMILHQQKMKFVSPAIMTEIAETWPTLRLEPLAGAVRYDVSWLESNSPDKNPSERAQGKSTTTDVTFP